MKNYLIILQTDINNRQTLYKRTTILCIHMFMSRPNWNPQCLTEWKVTEKCIFSSLINLKFWSGHWCLPLRLQRPMKPDYTDVSDQHTSATNTTLNTSNIHIDCQMSASYNNDRYTLVTTSRENHQLHQPFLLHRATYHTPTPLTWYAFQNFPVHYHIVYLLH